MDSILALVALAAFVASTFAALAILQFVEARTRVDSNAFARRYQSAYDRKDYALVRRMDRTRVTGRPAW